MVEFPTTQTTMAAAAAATTAAAMPVCLKTAHRMRACLGSLACTCCGYTVLDIPKVRPRSPSSLIIFIQLQIEASADAICKAAHALLSFSVEFY